MQNSFWFFPSRPMAVLFALLATLLFAEEREENATLPAGHSAHGDAFDEGPRQRAYIMKGMPKVNFPVTTKNPKCQAFFNQGIGQLHGFWNLEAERLFRQAAVIDPTWAMAYWGMARANTGNEKRPRASSRRPSSARKGRRPGGQARGSSRQDREHAQGEKDRAGSSLRQSLGRDSLRVSGRSGDPGPAWLCSFGSTPATV